MPFKFNPTTSELDLVQDLSPYALEDDVLHLDQTTPQEIINGIPLLEETRVIDETHELADKMYVDNAVTSLGQRFYMLSTASGVETYYNTSITASAEVESSITATDPIDNEFIAGWISPTGGAPTKLIAGLYDWDIFAEKTGAGNKVFRLYWTLVERKADNSEVVIATSAESNLINSKTRQRIPLNLASDYAPSAGSRIVGKVYARLVSGVSAANIVLYSEGASDSHWEIPTNKEILDTVYAQLSGATFTDSVIAPHLISNQSKTYAYNIDGTINTITFSDGRVITYTYTSGEITSWTDTIRTWTVVRDVDGNITNINIT